MPPEGKGRHRDGGEEPDAGGQFRVPRRGSVWRWKMEREVRRLVQARRAVEG